MTILPHHKLETNSTVKLTKFQEGKHAPCFHPRWGRADAAQPLTSSPDVAAPIGGYPRDSVLASFSSLISNPKTAGGPRVVICCTED